MAAVAPPLDTYPELFRDLRKFEDVDEGEKAPSSEVSVIRVAKEVLSGVKKGSDVTNIALPASILDPVSSLQKGMKSMQRGELLPVLCATVNPEERFFEVMRFFFSGLPTERFGKKPYNPILGESFRAGFRHRDPAHGTTFLLCEQVSHHPPITALHLNNPMLGFEMNSMNRPEPRFYGNYLEIKLHGIIRIYLHRFGEEYHITRPIMQQSGLLGIGSKRVEFCGTSFVACEETDLLAVLEFKSKGVLGITGVPHTVRGSVRRLSTDEVLYHVDGVWVDKIYITPAGTNTRKVLFDYVDAKRYTMKAFLPEESTMENTNSLLVWKQCSEAIWRSDAQAASNAKKIVEDRERALRKEREAKNEEWQPQFFVPHQSGEGYVLKASLRPRTVGITAESAYALPIKRSPLRERLAALGVNVDAMPVHSKLGPMDVERDAASSLDRSEHRTSLSRGRESEQKHRSTRVEDAQALRRGDTAGSLTSTDNEASANGSGKRVEHSRGEHARTRFGRRMTRLFRRGDPESAR